MRALSANETKQKFIQSIHTWLKHTLEQNGKGEYISCFNIEGSSIICDLPKEYFSNFDIPNNTRIEMKFVTKRI